MGISIHLPPDLEQRVRASAERAGLEVDQYIIEILEQSTAPLPEVTKEVKETRLLEKINASVSSATLKRFDYLRDERRIDPEEQAELIRITNEIEAADVVDGFE